MVRTDKKKILEEIVSHTPDQYDQLVLKAAKFAEKHHKGEKRFSGHDVYIHLINVAKEVATRNLDTDSIIAALLHQTPYDLDRRDATYLAIKEQFGDGVEDLVRKLEEINTVAKTVNIVDFKTISNYILSNVKDLRVGMIKVCDTYDNVNTIEHLPYKHQRNFAQKVFNIFAPIAEFLNFYDLKAEMEEKALKSLKPEQYTVIEDRLKRMEINETLLEDSREHIETLLEILGYKGIVKGRIKSVYSIYRKQKKYAAEGYKISDIKDLLAFYVILENKEMVYKFLNGLSELTEIDPTEIEDYIEKPKPNGYSAIHAHIRIPDISPVDFEIQILTPEMHYTNTYGPASHYAYKEALKRYPEASDEYGWLENIHNAIEAHINVRETRRSIPIPGKVLENTIFCLTPDGKLIQLKKGSTVLDFAYRVHTEIGEMAVSGKIDGGPAKLDKKLKSGQTVEIIVDRNKLSSNGKK